MTVAFSTSSPFASVAVFDGDGGIVWSGSEHAPQQASGACLRLLEASGVDLGGVELFAADIGPGSFTGVRVGVVLAKTLAFAHCAKVAGADAFDLVAADRVVVLPSKKGEFFVRVPGESPFRTADLPEDFVGYGNGLDPARPPSAAGFGPLLANLSAEDPMTFAPAYLIEPSISIPKKPYRHV